MKKQTEQDLLRRARARGLLQHRDPRRPPSYIEVQFVGCVGPVDGRKTPNFEFTKAELFESGPAEEATASFERGADESVEDFKARVVGELPATPKSTWTAVFYSPNIVTPPIPEPVQ